MGLLLLGLAGCQFTGEAIDADVTYFADIAPLYAARCVACHSADGIGPFALDVPSSARLWADASQVAMESRRMPPFLMTADGSCGEWRNSGWLTDDELKLHQRWIDLGLPVGEPRSIDSAPPQFLESPEWVFQTPEIEPEITGGELTEFDEYRCFYAENPFSEDRYLTGYEVRPGVRSLVHHVIGVAVVPEASSGIEGRTNEEQAQVLGADGRPGWPCISGAGFQIIDEGQPLGWVPGQGVVTLPGGSGVLIRPDQDLIFQVHYNLVDPEVRGVVDTTEIRMQMKESVEKPGWMVFEDRFLDTVGDEEPARIPPGESSFQYAYELPARWLARGREMDPEQTLWIRSVSPHMHGLGQTMNVKRIRESSEECLADIEQWDVNWQLTYFYEEPVDIVVTDRLEVSCTWNSEGIDSPTVPGWGATNEMCLPLMFVTSDR